jgi:hypothetical protein
MVLLDYRWHRHGGDKNRREKKTEKYFKSIAMDFFTKELVP